jgi:flagellar basal body-associated protein FliL
MKKKNILFLLLGLIIVAGIAAYMMWNKPHPKAEDKKGIPVTAVSLFKEYSTNETAANQQYLNKVLEVTGAVSTIDTNQDGAVAVILQTDDIMNGIMCTMRDKNQPLSKGSSVTIKGFCSGFVGDVKLTDCVIK